MTNFEDKIVQQGSIRGNIFIGYRVWSGSHCELFNYVLLCLMRWRKS